MAKGKVSQDEFDAGLSGAEGFRALKKAGVKRDTPFGRDKVLPKVRSLGPKEADSKQGRGRTSSESGSSDASVQPSAPKVSILPKGKRQSRFKDPSLEEVPFSFRANFRDKADALARRIQRRRRGLPGDRVTASMLYRVFSEVGLEDFEWEDDDLVQTEPELKALVRKRLGLAAGEG